VKVALIDAVLPDLAFQPKEPVAVVPRALFGVVLRRAHRDQERPVGRLRQQQFARQLVQRPFLDAVRVGVLSGEVDHLVGHDVEVRIDPVVAGVQPHFVVALVPPRRRFRLDDLQFGKFLEVTHRGGHLEHVLVVMDLARQVFEEIRPFEPPVPEQFRVVDGHHHRRTVHHRPEVFHLPFAVEHEVTRVGGRRFLRGARRVGLFVSQRHPARYFEIFQADVPTDAVFVQVRTDVFVIEVVAHVPVELTVTEVARISHLGGPDLLGRLHVSAEERHALLAVNGREDPIPRTRGAEQQSVRIQKGEPDAVFLQDLVHSGSERAFGQPDPLRGTAEMTLVIVHGHADLGVTRFLADHERQISMGGAAGDDLQMAVILQAAEPFEQASVAGVHDLADAVEVSPIHLGGLLERGRQGPRAVDFFFGQFDELVQPGAVTVHQELVGKHVAQRRGERHGEG